MENECKWYQNALMSELIEGMELTKQLNTHLINLSATSFLHPQQFHLLQNILSSYQKALLILQPLQSPSSPNVTPTTPTHDHHSKKRKISSNQVRIRSESGLESPSEDGYSWRKYGQKDILAAKYPRSYYRCTYRNAQGCRATKQVQRSDEDPSIFEITYKGKHTCNRHRSLPASSPSTPQILQETNHHHHHQMQQQQQEQEQQFNNEMLLNLKNSLTVDTHHNEQMMAAHFSFPSTSFDPFSTPFVDDNLLGGFSSSFGGFNDLSEIISANTSATNSPVIGYDLDFSNEPAQLDNFTFLDDQILGFSVNNCNWN